MEIIAEKGLLAAVENGTFIKGGSKSSCEGIKYDFVLSGTVLTVDSGRPYDMNSDSKATVIKPGEVAFVMTNESLDLPGNIYCQLSVKRKFGLDGIIILGGLIVDPNYKGKLIFGLYNVSSKNYPLLPGKKLVAGVFYKVDETSNKRPESITCFPEDLIKTVNDTKPSSVLALNNVIDSMRADILDIRNQLTHDSQWKNDFQNGLTKIQQIVDRISEKLDKEIDERKSEDAKLKNQTSVIRGIGLVLGAFFGGGVISLIVLYLAKVLGVG